MQITFFVANNPNPVESIQAHVIPPVGSIIRFPNRRKSDGYTDSTGSATARVLRRSARAAKPKQIPIIVPGSGAGAVVNVKLPLMLPVFVFMALSL